MAAPERSTSEEPSRQPPQEIEQAVDESSDVDGDFAALLKELSQKRRAAKDSPSSRLQKALPFITTFSPNIRPLTKSDLDSCIALENAAFPDPNHRASPEKVCIPSPYVAQPPNTRSRSRTRTMTLANPREPSSSNTASPSAPSSPSASSSP